MKNYIFIYYTIFLILFNNIFAVVHDLETDPLPPYVSSVISKIAVLVTCNLDHGPEKHLGFLFGKYLFISKYNFDNHKIISIEQIQKFDFVDNILSLKTFDASSFNFGKKPTEDDELYITLIEKSPFQLEIPPNYAKIFERFLSKEEFKNSLKDNTNEYYFIYFYLTTNKIYWVKYSTTDIVNSISPTFFKQSIDSFFEHLSPLVGGPSALDIFLKLPPHSNRGIFVLCKQDTSCYITRVTTNSELELGVYFVNKAIEPYIKKLIGKKVKVD